MNKQRLEKNIIQLRMLGDKVPPTCNDIASILEAILEEPQDCHHDFIPGTSGYYCQKCNKYKV